MGNNIVIGISALDVGKNDDILISYALGSCVGICLYDKVNRIAGLSHILLPTSTIQKEVTTPRKFADTAISELLKAMIKIGGKKSFITAKIAGGANMFNWEGETIGDKNVKAVTNELRRLHVPLLNQDVGGDYGRTVLINASDGCVTIRALSKGITTL